MKNFDAEFKKAIKKMKPEKSAVRRAVLDGEAKMPTRASEHDFRMKIGGVLTACVSLVLVFGIIIGGAFLRGAKKPGGAAGTWDNTDYPKGWTSDDHYTKKLIDTETPANPGTGYDEPISGTEYPDSFFETDYPDDTYVDSTEPAETEITRDTETEKNPTEYDEKDYSCDPAEDFGIDVLDDVNIDGGRRLMVKIDGKFREMTSCISFESVYTDCGVEKTGIMFVATGNPHTFVGTNMFVPSIYMVMYDPDSNKPVAAKKWEMAGAVLVNSDVPDTFLLFGISYDLTSNVNGYFGVYRVTDSETGSPDFVLDKSCDSGMIHLIFCDDASDDDYFINQKYNYNYKTRLMSLVKEKSYAKILEAFGGENYIAGDPLRIPKHRENLTDTEQRLLSDILSITVNFGKE